MTKINITPEVVGALAWLRKGWDGDNSEAAIEAFVILDNAHVFRAIDDATGYDIDNPNPCTRDCTPHEGSVVVLHTEDCAAAPDPARDPAEYGDDTGYLHTMPARMGVGLPTLAPGAPVPLSFSDTHPQAARELGELIKASEAADHIFRVSVGNATISARTKPAAD